MEASEVDVVEGIDKKYVDDALRVTYDAFAKKFRIGFRDADDFLRLFRDSIDTASCFSAVVESQCVGVLTFQVSGRDFFRLRPAAMFTRFSPLRAACMLFNLMLLAEEPKPDEFVVASLAVAPSCRGMGVGTTLMLKAEERAHAMGKRTLSLGVIAENEGAIRLYERLGYATTKTWRGFFVRLVSGSTEVRRMEKPMVASPSPDTTSPRRDNDQSCA